MLLTPVITMRCNTMNDSGASSRGNAELPLVLLTVGGDDDEFLALAEHLERIARQQAPEFQSLVVAKPDMPKLMYNVLRARIGSLDNVYLRRLGDDECDSLNHESGTFLVSKLRRRTED